MLSVNLTFVGHASWEEIKEVQSWTPCGLTFKEVDLWKDQQIWYLRVTFQAHEITTVFSLKTRTDFFTKDVEKYLGIILVQNDIKMS